MSKKLITLSAVLLGTLLFWLFISLSFETWLALKGESMQKGRIVLDPITGEKLTIWMDSESSQKATQDKRIKFIFLESVEEFGPLHIGGVAPKGVVLRPLISVPESKFYVFFHRMGFGMCNNEDCATLAGRIVRCMGGWLAGDDQPETSGEVGLSQEDVQNGRASIVIVSDKEAKIIGIYPNHTEADIVPILRKFPEFEASLLECGDKYIKPFLDSI